MLDRHVRVRQPGRVTFDDPDLVLDIEIVGNRAGVALVPGGDLDVFPFAHVG